MQRRDLFANGGGRGCCTRYFLAFIRPVTKTSPCLALLILFLAFGGSPVVGAILFLDFNQNNSSIAAVEKASDELGESLLVYPNGQLLSVSKDNVAAIFKDVRERLFIANEELTTVVFSGHSGNLVFSGANGELNVLQDLHATEFSALFSTVKRLVLRGCYTTTLANVLGKSGWRSVFPNVEYIAGYQGKAWSSETAQSKSFMYEALAKSASFLAATNNDESVDIFQSFDHYKLSELGIWFKTSPGNEYYLTTKGVLAGKVSLDLADEAMSCANLETKKDTHQQIVRRYLLAEPGYENPPDDTRFSDLRSAYTFFQKNNHCTQLGIWEYAKVTDPLIIQPLIFYKNVQSNFAVHVGFSEFEMLAAELVAGSLETFELPAFAVSTRSALMQSVMRLSSMSTDNSIEYDAGKRRALRHYLGALQKSLVELSPSVIPQRWMTEPYSPVGSVFLSPYRQRPIPSIHNLFSLTER